MLLISYQISRLIVTWAAIVAAALPAVASLPAAAEPAFSFATAPGALPKTVVPVHYALELVPDLDKLTFTGTELIDIDVIEPTAHVTLNAMDLTIEVATLDGEAAAAIAFQEARQIVTFTFPNPVAAGRHRLRVGFAGRLDHSGRALFFFDYETGGGRKRMISTHLEPADARRVFPGFDEPAFKASFALTITVPQAFMAVSNMPVSGEAPAGGGRKRVAFQPTPRMSSYLLTVTAGELERIAADVDGVTIGLVTTRGKTGRGRYALDTAIDVLRYLNGYFGAPYPLPKLDLIAVPGGLDRAMENWGGITFHESRLLLDPAKNTEDTRRMIFTFVAHEIAHQWFGDLVTLAWWNNVWLNEGFASWMEAKTAEALHPDWQSWLDGGPVSFRQSAMHDDAGRASPPIQRPVATETEALAAFDSISYGKGQAVVRMVENYVGEDVFRAGIRAYIARHAYSNTTTADLWEALQTASGKPVAAVAAGFTEQGGIPLVVAEASCVGDIQHVSLRQERFTHDRFAVLDAATGEPAPKEPPLTTRRWRVPITRGGPGGAEESMLLDGVAEFAAGRCGDAVKLNFGGVGYYRVQYDAVMYAALAQVIDRLSPADRANLLGDTWALVETGRVAPDVFLALVDRLRGDDNRAVADSVIRALIRIDRLQRNRPERAAFQSWGRAVLRPLFDRVGWDAAPSEPADYARLRPRLISLLGTFDDKEIAAEAKRRFARFAGDPSALPAPLRETVVTIAGRNADRPIYDTMLALARGAEPDERQRYYLAAAGARDPDIAAETLALALTDELPAGAAGAVISTVASVGEHRDLAWSFFKANYDRLIARQKPPFQGNFATDLLAAFTDAAHARELASFAEAHNIAGGRAVVRARERTAADADLSAQLPAVDAWVKERASRP